MLGTRATKRKSLILPIAAAVALFRNFEILNLNLAPEFGNDVHLLRWPP
jgi:hypothetical protein